MNKQAEFELRGQGKTQCQAILWRLQAEPGRWVGIPELYEASGSYVVHSRISDLRKRGHRIEHRNEWWSNGGQRECRSFYRLMSEVGEQRSETVNEKGKI